MTDNTKPAFPDRLSVDPRSKFYVEAIFNHDVGIMLNGKERLNVEEYCISEGWVRVTVGNGKDRRGNPLTMKIHGPVEAYFKS